MITRILSLVFAGILAFPLSAGEESDIKSAGPLAFGPNGVLLVGDTVGAAVFAIETGDAEAHKAPSTRLCRDR